MIIHGDINFPESKKCTLVQVRVQPNTPKTDSTSIFLTADFLQCRIIFSGRTWFLRWLCNRGFLHTEKFTDQFYSDIVTWNLRQQGFVKWKCLCSARVDGWWIQIEDSEHHIRLLRNISSKICERETVREQNNVKWMWLIPFGWYWMDRILKG